MRDSIKVFFRTIRNLGQGLVTGLPEATADRDPFELFDEWFEAARGTNIIFPESMALATATPDGRPSTRMVLLKGVDERGFTFFTNYASRKAAELDSNPHAAIVIHWEVLQRQVRVAGTVRRITSEESADYFSTRPRGAQIGAWASKQSKPLSSRSELKRAVAETKTKYQGKDIPLPPFWGGYRIEPERIEFWQGRANRLHDRLVYIKDGEGWKTERLYP